MEPEPRTLRELVWGARAARRDAWSRTSSVLKLVYDAHKGKGAPRLTAEDFDPTREKEPTVTATIGIAELKMILNQRKE